MTELIPIEFINYGVLGAWTAWLLYEKQKILKSLSKTIDTNTQVLKDLCILLKNRKR